MNVNRVEKSRPSKFGAFSLAKLFRSEDDTPCWFSVAAVAASLAMPIPLFHPDWLVRMPIAARPAGVSAALVRTAAFGLAFTLLIGVAPPGSDFSGCQDHHEPGEVRPGDFSGSLVRGSSALGGYCSRALRYWATSIV